MRTLVDRAAAGVVLGICFAVAGCSSTIPIRPDQLPILTEAAARNGEHAAEVIGASGRRVRVKGTLEAVEITPGADDRVRVFQAPLAAALDGATLAVSNEKYGESFPLASMKGVQVTYDDKDLMLAGGVLLDILGGLCLAGATTVIFFASINPHGGGPILFLIAGLPLLTVTPAFLVPGVMLTKRGTRTPKYLLHPRPHVEVGLGSVRVHF
jgi:hypothetical protein